MGHNIKISFFKFLFAVLVVLFHGTIMFLDLDKIHIFKGGYIGVEFFFIVSGFLFAKSVSKKWNDDLNIGKDLFSFIKKKVLVFLPYVLLAHFIIFILKFILDDISLSDFILSFYDVFFIWMAGFNGIHFNPSIWYLSAMLIAMMIIYPLFRKYKNNYVRVLPIVLILGFGLLNKNYISLDISWNKWNGFFHWGLLRAFLEINLGVLIYFLVEKIGDIKITKLGKICLTGI